MQCTRKSHILKWLLSYTPRTKKETVMGTLAFYELLDESAYITVFLVTSHNTVCSLEREISRMKIDVFMPFFTIKVIVFD